MLRSACAAFVLLSVESCLRLRVVEGRVGLFWCRALLLCLDQHCSAPSLFTANGVFRWSSTEGLQAILMRNFCFVAQHASVTASSSCVELEIVLFVMRSVLVF